MSHDNIETHKSVNPVTAHKDACKLIDKFDMSSDILNASKEITIMMLPPPSILGIAISTELANNVLPNITKINSATLKSTADSWSQIAIGEKFTRSDAIATQYPLFTSIKHINNFLLKNEVDKSTIKIILAYQLTVCSYELNDTTFAPDIYYNDILAMRHTLTNGLSILNIDHTKISSSEKLEQFIIDKINHYFPKDSSDIKIEHKSWLKLFQRVLPLITGGRQVGKSVQNRYPTNTSNPTIDIHTDLIENNLFDCISDSEEMTSLPDGTGVEYYQENSHKDGTQENNFSVYIKRSSGKKGSRLTKRDDRLALSGRQAALEARNVISFSDMNRLPLPTITQYMSYVIEKDTSLIAVIWLLLSLGINDERISALTIANKFTTLSPSDNRIFIHENESIIKYHITDFSTDFSCQKSGIPSDTNCVISHIPENIANDLRYLIKTSSITDALKKLSGFARSFSSTSPGPTPTANRLSTSYWSIIHPNMNEGVDSACMTGCMPGRYKAQGHYYRIDRSDIYPDIVYANTATISLILQSDHASKKLHSFLNQATYPDHEPTGFMGSQVAQPVCSLQTLFKKLASRYKSYVQHLKKQLPAEQLNTIISILTLQHIQLYLIEQIALGLRPIGAIANTGISDEFFGACVQDKGSNIYTERGLSIVPPILSSIIKTIKIDLSRFIIYLSNKNIKLNILDGSSNEDIAMYFEVTKKNTVTIRRMTGSLFKTALTKHGLFQYFTSKSNWIRHSMATELYRKIPEPLRDEHLHHERGGMDICSPWSSVDIKSFHNSKKLITNVLLSLNITEITLGEIY